MIQVEDLIDIAIEKDASDIHLISGMKPMLRIIRRLEEIETYLKQKGQDWCMDSTNEEDTYSRSRRSDWLGAGDLPAWYLWWLKCYCSRPSSQ